MTQIKLSSPVKRLSNKASNYVMFVMLTCHDKKSEILWFLPLENLYKLQKPETAVKICLCGIFSLVFLKLKVCFLELFFQVCLCEAPILSLG